MVSLAYSYKNLNVFRNVLALPPTQLYMALEKWKKNIEAKSCLFSVFKGAYDSGCYKDQLKCYISSLTHKTKPTK